MASMEKDIQGNLSPMASAQKTALEPTTTAYYKAKAELDKLHEERMNGPWVEPSPREQKLQEICEQFDMVNQRYNGGSTFCRDDIAVAADRETEM